MKVEYMEVFRAGIQELNEYGEKGWQPATLMWEDFQWDRSVQIERPEGWTGVLFRKVLTDMEKVVDAAVEESDK